MADLGNTELATTTRSIRPPAWATASAKDPVPTHVPLSLLSPAKLPFDLSEKLVESEDSNLNWQPTWNTIKQKLEDAEERQKQQQIAEQMQAAAKQKESASLPPVPACLPMAPDLAKDLLAANDGGSELTIPQQVLKPEFPPTPFVPKPELDDPQEKLRVKPSLHPPRPEPQPALTPKPELLPKLDNNLKPSFFAEYQRNLQARPQPTPNNSLVFMPGNKLTPTLAFHSVKPSEDVKYLSGKEAKEALAKILSGPNSQARDFHKLNAELFQNNAIQLASINGSEPCFVWNAQHTPAILNQLKGHYEATLDGNKLTLADIPKPGFDKNVAPPGLPQPQPENGANQEEDENDAQYSTPRPASCTAPRPMGC